MPRSAKTTAEVKRGVRRPGSAARGKTSRAAITRLKEALSARGWSYHQLALRTGLGHSSIKLTVSVPTLGSVRIVSLSNTLADAPASISRLLLTADVQVTSGRSSKSS